MKLSELIMQKWFGVPALMVISILMIFLSAGIGIVGGLFDDRTEPKYQTYKLSLKEVDSEPPITDNADSWFEQTIWKYSSLKDEKHCLALNIYFEARDQDVHGQIAVGLVTLNRVLSKLHPNSVCKVVWEIIRTRKGRRVAQFSWTLDGKSDSPLNKNSWEQSVRIASSMLDEGSLFNIADFTGGSTYYHAHYVDPYWNKIFTPTIVVGDHLFYNPTPVARTHVNKL